MYRGSCEDQKTSGEDKGRFGHRERRNEVDEVDKKTIRPVDEWTGPRRGRTTAEGKELTTTENSSDSRGCSTDYSTRRG